MAPVGSESFRQFKVPFFSRLKLKNIFPGEWASIYTGEGIEYATSKAYEPGEDVRDLDLQTLVASGDEEVILREVGRQRRIYIWVDLSGSMQRFPESFFSQKVMVRDIAVGLAAFSAQNVYSPVGLCAFDQEIRGFFPARSGERYCQEIVGWFLDRADAGPRGPADIPGALAFLEKQVPPRSLVLFVSDFQDPLFEADFADLFRSVSKQFDFVPVVIRDPLERGAALTHSAVVALQDSESGRWTEFELSPKSLAKFQQVSAETCAHLEQTFHQVGLALVILDSPAIEDCYRTLTGFFEMRKRTVG